MFLLMYLINMLLTLYGHKSTYATMLDPPLSAQIENRLSVQAFIFSGFLRQTVCL